MPAEAIAALIILAVLVLIFVRTVRVVPQARAAVVERLGRYIRTQGPGLTILLPFVDRMRPLIDVREQVVSFPPQPVITSDNLTVGVDSVIYFQVTDPRAASYEIQNYIQAVEQLTITTLRNVIGSLNLEQALTSRDEINTKLRGVLDDATGPWGIRVARVEIKAIDQATGKVIAYENISKAFSRLDVATNEGRAADVLRFLIAQHGLKQRDLADDTLISGKVAQARCAQARQQLLAIACANLRCKRSDFISAFLQAG